MSAAPAIPAAAAPVEAPAAAGTTASRVRLAAEVALLAVLVALGIVIALAGADPLTTLDPVAIQVVPDWIRGPLRSLSVSISDGSAMLLVLGMAVCYVGLLALGASLGARRIFMAVVVLNVALALSAPLLSADVFNYIDYGRLGAIHGLNPYEATPSTVPTDPFWQLAGWHNSASAYGPLFTWLSYGVVKLGVSASLWTFKALAAVFSVACVALIWVLARQLGRPPGLAMAAFGLNPVVLVWVVGGAHNDLLMVVLLLAGAALVVAAREATGATALVAAAAVKATGALAWPFLALAAPRRTRMVAWSVAAAALITIVSYITFPHVGGDLFTTLRKSQFENSYSIPSGVSGLIGIKIGSLFRAVLYAILLVSVAWQLVRVWRGADWVDACGWAFAALVATSLRSPIWYPVWPLAFAAIARDRRLLVATLAMQTYFVVATLPVIANWP